jgi:hypothetical protein
MKPQLLFLTLLSLAGVGCTPTPQAGKQQNVTTEQRSPSNGIYYWKTVFQLNETERDFLEEHHVKRLYLRFFDVVPADKSIKSDFDFEAVPNATIAFKDAVPDNVEIIPVVYITIDALRLIIGSRYDYAGLITERILNMADFNELGAIKEVQLDCDWTQQTQDGYFALCQAVKDKLEPYGIQLSCTIRLWQLACACPPVDRGALMLYNTGSITNPNTQNSILDLNDVSVFLKDKAYGIPLDYAYPTYSWYVWFRNNQYMGLFHELPENDTMIQASDVVRHEQVSFDELRALDSLVRLRMPEADSASVILYHLDSTNLSNYTTDEICQIYHCH